MKMQRMTINHIIVAMLFIGGMFVVVVGAAILFKVIVPYADVEAVFLAQVFIGVAWTLAWVLRGIWKSSRDYTVADMGRITLKTYIGEIQQVYENKYGKADRPTMGTDK